MKIVLVKWLDAARTDGDIGPGWTPVMRRTVAWLLYRDKERLVLAMSRDGDLFERGFAIPTEYVKSVKTLAVVP
jgi:hypothetical protein